MSTKRPPVAPAHATIAGRGVSFPDHSRGSVFSAHARAINVRVSGFDELLTLALDPASMTVTSILMTLGPPAVDFAGTSAKPHDPFILDPHSVGFASVVIPTVDAADLRLFDGLIAPIPNDESPPGAGANGQALHVARKELLGEIERVGHDRGLGALAPLLRHGRPGSAIPDDPFARAAWQRIAASGPGESPMAVAGLIGLGQGLTPSGDDFAVGYLAARALLCAPPLNPVQTERFRDRLASTTLPGATIVRQALRGRFPAYLCDFVDALRGAIARGHSLAPAVAAAATHGYSSGVDALVGFAYGLCRPWVR